MFQKSTLHVKCAKRALWQGALVGTAAIMLMGSTDSSSGTIVTVKLGKKPGTVTTVTNVTGIDYQSSPTRWIGQRLTHSTQPKGLTATALEGRLMDSTAFAKAVQPGMHGMIYEGLWRDLFVQPRHENGRLVAHDADAKTLTLQHYRTIKTTHWPEAAPVLLTVPYADDTQYFVENDESTLDEVLSQSGSSIQVYPERPQLIMVETEAGRFDENKMPENGGRGGANKHCANAIFVRRIPGEGRKPQTKFEFKVQ